MERSVITMDQLGESIRKLILAGIGMAALAVFMALDVGLLSKI